MQAWWEAEWCAPRGEASAALPCGQEGWSGARLSPDIRSVGTRSCLVVKQVRQNPGIKELSKSTGLSAASQRATGHMPRPSAGSGMVEGAIRTYMWGTWGEGSHSGPRPRPKPDGKLSSWRGRADLLPAPLGGAALLAGFLAGRREPGQASGEPSVLGEGTLGWGGQEARSKGHLSSAPRGHLLYNPATCPPSW